MSVVFGLRHLCLLTLQSFKLRACYPRCGNKMVFVRGLLGFSMGLVKTQHSFPSLASTVCPWTGHLTPYFSSEQLLVLFRSSAAGPRCVCTEVCCRQSRSCLNLSRAESQQTWSGLRVKEGRTNQRSSL